MRDGMQAMMDARRIGLPEKGKPLPRGYLLDCFRRDCEYAAKLRSKSTHSDARHAIETGKNRTFTALIKRWKFGTVARHTKQIEAILDRVEQSVGTPQSEIFEVKS